MATVPDIGFEPTIPVLLRQAVARFADRDLIVMDDRRATYAQIDGGSRRLARRLMADGVGKGTRVAMHFAYSPEFLIAFLAVTRIGALAIPFSTAYAPGELRRGLRRNDIHTFLVPPKMMGRNELAFIEGALPALAGRSGPHFCAEMPHLRQVWVLGPSDRPWATAIDLAEESSLVDDAMLDEAEAEVAPGDWMVVISTSGSTAEPKGVVHTHGTVIRKTAGAGLGYGVVPEPHAIFAAMPLFWIGGLISLTGALANGTTMVCQERFEATDALDLIERERCVAVTAWISITQALREHPSLDQRDLSSIPMLTAPVSSRPYGTVLGMTESCGPHLTQPHPVYGMDLPEHLRGSLGIAAPHFDHKIVDPDDGSTVIEGDGEGELCIRGYATLATLYKLERHQVFDDDGYYHTGDRVRREEGLYFFTGRVTEMIKAHGANVAPPEVEAVLESLPEVKFAFVVGIPDAERGEQVAAVVVPSGEGPLDVSILRDKTRAELSAFKVPRTVVCMAEEEVPWLATGKPDKRAMKSVLTEAAANLRETEPPLGSFGR